MKPLGWIGSSKRDLETMPNAAQREIRAALFAAENGQRVDYAKAMRGDLRGVVYYVGEELIYALHFFQKKK